MTDIETCFKKVVENIAADRNYNECKITITPISSGGANYTSELFTATIAGQGNDEDKKVLNLFGKVSILPQDKRDEIGFVTWNTENYFYTTLMKKYREIEDMYGVSGDQRLNVPEFYAYSPTYLRETLVLEDLVAAGYEPYDQFIPLEWKFAHTVVKELAKFHALGFAFRALFPDEYDAVLKSGNCNFDPKYLRTLVAAPVAMALETVKPEYKEMLKNFVDKYMTNYFTELFKPEHTPVLSHLDFRTSNIMYKVREDGELALKIVDFQCPSEACPVTDLLNFTIFTVDEGFRAKHFSELMDAYYTELSAALSRYKLNAEELYPKEIFESELKSKLPYAFGIALSVLPYMTKDKVDVESLVGVELADMVNKPGKSYAKQLHGLIEDYINFGVLQK